MGSTWEGKASAPAPATAPNSMTPGHRPRRCRLDCQLGPPPSPVEFGFPGAMADLLSTDPVSQSCQNQGAPLSVKIAAGRSPHSTRGLPPLSHVFVQLGVNSRGPGVRGLPLPTSTSNVPVACISYVGSPRHCTRRVTTHGPRHPP